MTDSDPSNNYLLVSGALSTDIANPLSPIKKPEMWPVVNLPTNLPGVSGGLIAYRAKRGSGT